MPSDAPATKISALRNYGTIADLIDVHETSRAKRCAELMELHPDAYLAHPSDDNWVIEGNSTLGRASSRQ